MANARETAWTAADYDRAARACAASLPLKHYVEALPQSTQRKITLESLDVLTIRRPEGIPELDLEVGVRDGWLRFWHLNELLPLPVDADRQIKQLQQRAEQQEKRAIAAEAAIARLQALLEKAQGNPSFPGSVT